MSDDEKRSISLPLADGDAPTETDGAANDGGDIHDEIAREVAEHDILLYMKGIPQQPMCGFSARAAAILASYGEPFHAVNILQDQTKRQGIKDFSNWPTIPQIYIGGEFIGGSDILMEMHEKGELAALIEEATQNS